MCAETSVIIYTHTFSPIQNRRLQQYDSFGVLDDFIYFSFQNQFIEIPFLFYFFFLIVRTFKNKNDIVNHLDLLYRLLSY